MLRWRYEHYGVNQEWVRLREKVRAPVTVDRDLSPPKREDDLALQDHLRCVALPRRQSIFPRLAKSRWSRSTTVPTATRWSHHPALAHSSGWARSHRVARNLQRTQVHARASTSCMPTRRSKGRLFVFLLRGRACLPSLDLRLLARARIAD